MAPGAALRISSSNLIITELLSLIHLAIGLGAVSSKEEEGGVWGRGAVGWAGVWAALPPSVASRETPQHVPPGVQGDGTVRRRPAAHSQASLPPRIDVVRESGLFSLGCGEDYSEIIGFQLSGAQL